MIIIRSHHEERDEHITTGKSPQPRGRTTPSLPIMGVSNGDGDGGGVDGNGSGGNSPSRQGARIKTSVPRISSSVVAALRNFSWISDHGRFFVSGRRIYR